MSTYIIDACAMIAYLADEIGADRVESIMHDVNNICYAHAINLAEVYRHFVKHESVATADEAMDVLRNETPIIQVERMAESSWKLAGRLYAEITALVNPTTGKKHKLSMADCCAIGTAEEYGGHVVSSDWLSLELPQEKGLCRVEFFRSRGAHGPKDR